MEALHARYPFLADAREAVSEADVDLAAVAADGGPIVERALERIRLAIEEGTIGTPRRPRVELLSYPVARVLISLVDQPGLVHRYARAEADAARERFVADVEAEDALRSVARDRLGLAALLAEFDLEEQVGTAGREVATAVAEPTSATDDAVRVDVDAYLRLTAGLPEPRWRLPARSLADGAVTVSREELYDLLREAIRERIESDLPLSVPEEISGSLDPAVTELEAALADLDHDWDIDAVDPELFPPCIKALLDSVDAGDPLPDHSRFTLVSFLATAGMGTDEIIARLDAHDDLDAGRLGTRLDHLRADGGDATYPPPSCETMVAYGDCVNTDDLCERIAHPLEYYERRLAGEDPG
ncbi:MAG: DNA primase regulatory subunit PriL [Halobacteriales archaeon]